MSGGIEEVGVAAEIGQKAPEFTLPAESWEDQVSLKDLTSEGPVALFFYPGDWSSVCTGQLSQLQEQLSRFEEKGAKVAAVSADSPWSHKAFAEQRGITFPLLSDFRREMIPGYGVEHEGGFPQRAYFVIGQDGIIRAKRVEDTPRDQPEIQTVLEDLEKAL